MRITKITLIFFTSLLCLVLLFYFFRLAIVNRIIATQFDTVAIKVNCLDVSIRQGVVVNKLCINTPQADVQLHGIGFVWQYQQSFSLQNLTIDTAHVYVKSQAFLRAPLPPTESSLNLRDPQVIVNLMQPYVKAISSIQLPSIIESLTFALKQIQWFDLPAASNLSEKLYAANVNIEKNEVSFLLTEKLKNKKNSHEVVKFNVVRNKQGFIVTIDQDLALISPFIKAYSILSQSPLSATIAQIYSKGQLKSEWRFTNQKLMAEVSIDNLNVGVDNTLKNSAQYEVSGRINVGMELPLNQGSNTALTVHFYEPNLVELQLSSANIIALLSQFDASLTHASDENLFMQIKAIVKENAFHKLNLQIPHDTQFTYKKDQMSIKVIDDKMLLVKASDWHDVTHEKAWQLQLASMSFSLSENLPAKRLALQKIASNTLALQSPTHNDIDIARFVLDVRLTIPALKDYTRTPVTIHIDGKMQPQADSVKAVIASSFVSMNQLKVNIKNKEKNDVSLQIATFLSDFSGNLTLFNNKEIMFAVDAKTYANELLLANINASGTENTAKISVSGEDIALTEVLSLADKLPVKLSLISGKASYQLNAEPLNFQQMSQNEKPLSLKANIALSDVSGDFDGVWFQALNWQQAFNVKGKKITTEAELNNNLTLELIEMGIPVSNIALTTQGVFDGDVTLQAHNVNAHLLGGRVTIPSLSWPTKKGHSANVQLHGIDLAQVLALNQHQGIVITGDISGALPILFDGINYRIEQGELFNVTDGLIKVSDNPAVESLKEGNSQLQIAFDALQNVQYHQLTSSVSTEGNSNMLLATQIKGYNPDIDNEVNLNLNLTYDVLGLLNSLIIKQRLQEKLLDKVQH